MQHLSSLLLESMSSLRKTYGLNVESIDEDNRGVILNLSSQKVNLMFSYDTYTAEFYVRLTATVVGNDYKIPLDEILRKNGIQYPVHRPRTREGIKSDSIELAELLDRYAGEGLRGNPDFFRQYEAD